jgi:hypothetical protein
MRDRDVVDIACLQTDLRELRSYRPIEVIDDQLWQGRPPLWITDGCFRHPGIPHQRTAAVSNEITRRRELDAFPDVFSGRPDRFIVRQGMPAVDAVEPVSHAGFFGKRSLVSGRERLAGSSAPTAIPMASFDNVDGRFMNASPWREFAR